MMTRILFIVAIGWLQSCSYSSSYSVPEKLIVYRGETISTESLPYVQQKKLYDIEIKAYKARLEIIRDLVIEKYLNDKAKELGKSPAEVRNFYFADKPITEKQRRKYFNSIKHSVPYSYELVKFELDERIREERLNAVRFKVLKEAEVAAKIGLYPQKPVAPLTDQVSTGVIASSGSPSAKVSVVEFADFTCPHCKAAAPAVAKLKKKYGDRIQFGFRPYLLRPQGYSQKLATAGYCAAQQGKFWDYHDHVFKNQDLHSVLEPDALSKIGINLDNFNTCVGTSIARTTIEAGQIHAMAIGVTSTPTFFVNGRLISSGENLSDVEKAIEEAL